LSDQYPGLTAAFAAVAVPAMTAIIAATPMVARTMARLTVLVIRTPP
jgi:hypothetical protein